VVLWGAYDYFLAGSPDEETAADVAPVVEKTPDGASHFIADIVKKLPSRERTRRNRLIIERASREWPQDPFIPMEIPREEEPVTVAEGETPPLFAPDITYSGFLQLGDRRLAVINGMEYEKNEIVEPGTYVLKTIFPDRVMIGTVSGRRTFTVLLEDTGTFPVTNRK